MWPQHLKVCLVFLLLIIPVWVWDKNQSSGGFIKLDGLIITHYLLFLAIHLPLSSLAIKFFPSIGVGASHFLSVLLSVLIFAIGVRTYVNIKDSELQKHFLAQKVARKKFFNVIKLNYWGFSPNPDQATELVINVTTSVPGRFEASARGYEITDAPEMVHYFESTIGDSVKLFVEKDSNFMYHIPLKRSRDGVPKSVAVYLRLFDSSGEPVNTKVFETHPDTDDDGSYFYAELPPPSLIK
jgi:hypothetical protein